MKAIVKTKKIKDDCFAEWINPNNGKIFFFKIHPSLVKKLHLNSNTIYSGIIRDNVLIKVAKVLNKKIKRKRIKLELKHLKNSL